MSSFSCAQLPDPNVQPLSLAARWSFSFTLSGFQVFETSRGGCSRDLWTDIHRADSAPADGTYQTAPALRRAEVLQAQLKYHWQELLQS